MVTMALYTRQKKTSTLMYRTVFWTLWEKWYKNVSVLSEVSQTPRHKHCEILLSGRCEQSSPQTQKAGPQTPHGKGGGEGEDTEAVPHMDRTSSGKMRKLWTGMWRQ